MEKHNIWSPENMDMKAKTLFTIWVFKNKTDKNGNLSEFKAQLCVKGYHQKEGFDYLDVFSPTSKLASLRLLLTICCNKNLPIKKMDIKCTFLHGNPDKIIHIHKPEGYCDYPNNQDLLLKKYLYGLKQIPHCWHQALKSALPRIGL
ncbi:hypothetical protein O181_000809 [Austropuccinia psidii MF-1]|uniref:Reverse transcriptase Ty1/copia-type domain-containing protein n=1 Tax=Austropuccinia psidii MF-1 TaxID=1389203 RepID=A0A9Q3GB94_9BASI|nr:hypothetical protein [Austropuccinia psidii MF-1]